MEVWFYEHHKYEREAATDNVEPRLDPAFLSKVELPNVRQLQRLMPPTRTGQAPNNDGPLPITCDPYDRTPTERLHACSHNAGPSNVQTKGVSVTLRCKAGKEDIPLTDTISGDQKNIRRALDGGP